MQGTTNLSHSTEELPVKFYVIAEPGNDHGLPRVFMGYDRITGPHVCVLRRLNASETVLAMAAPPT